MPNTQMTLEQLQQQALQFHQSGQLEYAERTYRNILSTYSGDPITYANLAAVLFNQQKAAESMAILEEGLGKFPDNVDMLTAMGSALAAQGQAAKGIECVEKAIQLAPEESGVHLSMANVLYQNGQFEEAAVSCKKAIGLNSQIPQSYFVLGNILTANQDYDGAIAAYQTLIDKVPQWPTGYISLAKLMTDRGDYSQALELYLQAKELAPEFPEIYEGMGMVLHISGRLEEAEVQFRLSLEKNEANADSYVLLGNVLRDQDRQAEAVEVYQKALQYHPDHPVAQQNLKLYRLHKISRWHFDMLADYARNDAYDQALKRAVSESSHVLDIGTGAGLLSMMAVRAGAKCVHTCEKVPELYDVAQQVFADNGMQNDIKIINKQSTQLEVGDDIPQKVDVLVSEILDAGLLGEGVIPTLRHALENLVQPDVTVLPKIANVYAVLIESDYLKRMNPIDEISGFDLSAFDAYRTDEKYAALSLAETPHQTLSDDFPVLAIDFKQLPPFASPEEPNTSYVPVTISRDGCVHGIAFWFELHVDDHASFSTGVGGESFHWKQAVQIFDKELSVKEGETIDIKVLQSDMAIGFDLE